MGLQLFLASHLSKTITEIRQMPFYDFAQQIAYIVATQDPKNPLLNLANEDEKHKSDMSIIESMGIKEVKKG